MRNIREAYKLKDTAFEEFFFRNMDPRIWGASRGVRDKISRWWPVPEEVAPCCLKVGKPTYNFTLALHIHCRTILHIANLYGIDYKEFKKEVTSSENYQILKDEKIKRKTLAAVMGAPKWKPPYKMAEDLKSV